MLSERESGERFIVVQINIRACQEWLDVHWQVQGDVEWSLLVGHIKREDWTGSWPSLSRNGSGRDGGEMIRGMEKFPFVILLYHRRGPVAMLALLGEPDYSLECDMYGMSWLACFRSVLGVLRNGTVVCVVVMRLAFSRSVADIVSGSSGGTGRTGAS